MSSKLGLKVMDAYLSGDQDRIQAVQAEVAARLPKRIVKSGIVSYVQDNISKPTTSAVEVDKILTTSLGVDWAENELETIWKLVFTDMGIALDDRVRDKVSAIKAIKISDAPFHEWYSFNQVCMAVGGQGSDFLALSMPTPGQVVYTIALMSHFRPKEEFGEEVLKFVCILLYNNGIYTPPPTIKDIINNVMKWTVSRESQLLWPDVYSRYHEWINKDIDDIVPDETQDDIQAYRIVICEKAAKSYLQEK